MKSKSVGIILGVLAGLFVLAVIGWLVVGSVAADQVTLPTRLFNLKVTPEIFGMKYENVDFLSRDGSTKLAGWYIPSSSNERVILFVHGRNASRTAAYGGPPDKDGNQPVPGRLLEFCAKLHQSGYSVFIFDLRGHGQSGDGRYSFGQKERLDVLAAIDWLKERGFQPGKIGLMGLSLGSAASIGATLAEPAVGALVIDSGFARLSPVVYENWVQESGLPLIFLHSTRLMVRLNYGWDINAVNPVDEIKQIESRQIFIIHCQDDKILPLSHFEQLTAAAPSAQTWLLPHCVHGQTYSANPEIFAGKVIDFFDHSMN